MNTKNLDKELNRIMSKYRNFKKDPINKDLFFNSISYNKDLIDCWGVDTLTTSSIFDIVYNNQHPKRLLK